MALFRKKSSLPTQDEALPGRAEPLKVPATHYVNQNRIVAPFPAGRYHSLVISPADVPAELEVAAHTQEDGTIMAVRHRTYPVHGVQFHPESVLTDEGRTILRNFLDL